MMRHRPRFASRQRQHPALHMDTRNGPSSCRHGRRVPKACPLQDQTINVLDIVATRAHGLQEECETAPFPLRWAQRSPTRP
ncbi:hypothetical protein VTK73DRAFT_3887 [Phialemonium thermophilum]|uniref:Uncharacterized protein n=1 Tax=Phialemonium thermophilum TaxID=223376 RepID=A0ABR3VDL7_9PEZI